MKRTTIILIMSSLLVFIGAYTVNDFKAIPEIIMIVGFIGVLYSIVRIISPSNAAMSNNKAFTFLGVSVFLGLFSNFADKHFGFVAGICFSLLSAIGIIYSVLLSLKANKKAVK